MTEYTPMTEEERFLFDLKGYILFPAVLSEDEIAPIKEQCVKLRTDRESLPTEAQCLPGGAASVLIDHPAIMRVLHSIIDDETEKIRLEGCFLSWRERNDGHKGWTPHAGGKSVNPNYSYQYHNGRIHAGMTRVVWELNGVEQDRGGTAFIPGSHKSNFRPFPECFDARDSGVWDTYGCPPGSLLIFSEAVRHTACPWEQDDPRCALFFCYNHINVRHHKPDFTDEMLGSLSEAHRRFFNDVYHPQFDGEKWRKRREGNKQKAAV
ncbi:MAG: phytanoyl-CoA dioxygenase family protein [bacterium]|nr:phytanoyl-CoA dioxygenase family protein [bacterium]